MAKPSWITIISGSTGSGSETRSLKASSHTGRITRVSSITGVTSGGASDYVVLSQDGVSEFITIDKTSYSVTALGGTVKITGTSNSPSLKLTNLIDSSLLSNFALKVNGTAYSWDGNASHLISDDPGALASYTFEISFDVAENQTESSKSITFKLTDSGDSETSSETITITQAAGEKTYGSWKVDFRYREWSIPASGGIASPTYSFFIPWGWNGKTSGGGTLTQADTHTATYAYYNSAGPDSPFDWTLDPTTGVITMASLKANQTTSDSGPIYIKILIKINGKTLWDTDYVIQDENIATYTLSSASVSLDDIPASGGTADSPSFIEASGTISYTSGDSDTPSITSSDVTITLSKTVKGSNLGSTVKARTKLDTVTATITWNGSQVTQSIDVYQQANQATYSSVNSTAVGLISPKNGGDIDIARVNPVQTATYTSGATRTITDFTYEFTSVPSWVTIDELNLKATVDKNITGLTRDGDIEMKITGEGSKSTTGSISIHQEYLVIPSWDVPATFHFDSIGQSDLSPAGLDLNIADPDNVGWTIEGPSYVADSLNNNPLPISGTGDKSMSLTPGPNASSSERTFDLSLLTSSGTVIATCECTQDASESGVTWDLPATLTFEAGGDVIAFNITDKDSAGWRLTLPDWCFVSDGITEGSGDHETDLAARANDTGSARTGYITLYPAGSSTMTMRCEVSQNEDLIIEQK